MKHPNAYARVLAEQELPAAGFELLGSDESHTEAVMLSIRMRTGLPGAGLGEAEVGWGRADARRRVAGAVGRPAGADRPWSVDGRRGGPHPARRITESMLAERQFSMYGPSHWAALAVFAIGSVLLVWIGRRQSENQARALGPVPAAGTPPIHPPP